MMWKEPRPIRIEGDVAYVTLTKGYEAVIDASDVPLVAGHHWRANLSLNTVYALTTKPGTRGSSVLMHRILMGDDAGPHVDHKDGNGLNNRRSNLRAATVAQNQYNARLRKDNSSGFKGVYRVKSARKWRACIKLNGVERYLGQFSNPEDAHAAYVQASMQLHGEFRHTPMTQEPTND